VKLGIAETSEEVTQTIQSFEVANASQSIVNITTIRRSNKALTLILT